LASDTFPTNWRRLRNCYGFLSCAFVKREDPVTLTSEPISSWTDFSPTQILPPGRVPHVRLRVRGPKKTGEAFECFYVIDHQSRVRFRKSNRNISSSAHVRWGERGAPVQGEGSVLGEKIRPGKKAVEGGELRPGKDFVQRGGLS
jgi:hypothetical protein